MSRKRGDEGEDIACEYLESLHQTIICRNYSSRFGEIDIISKYKNTIRFVEVKYIKDSGFGSGADRITFAKLKKINKTAEIYLLENNLLNENWSIDAVIIEPTNNRIEYLTDIYN